jgi:hypothetical protein
MMSVDDIRDWRDREKERVASFANPRHKRLESVILDTLNIVLGEN